ncbi:hypothetical protein HOLleu_22404 [Holothuria leucospilota]|uniref:Uncharacterized protein n=1 Tax=Holothuria leucospilota TaxID=206669 RepID=A0A9Q1BYU0_HOLLE|nr:hypothetical protein HOLleu_22404 [Holothuria leucospilota]
MTSWYLYRPALMLLYSQYSAANFQGFYCTFTYGDGLGLGSDSGPLDSDSAWTREVPDSELARNWGHWNRNWLGLGLGGLGYSPENNLSKSFCSNEASSLSLTFL